MSEPNERLSESLAEQAFVVLQARKGFTQPRSADKPVMYAEILHYVLGNDNIDVDRVSKALSTHLSNRRVYKTLLAQHRCAYAPREAHAQDTESVDQRIGQGFNLQFRAAKSRPGQMYIILEIDFHNLVAGDKPLVLHVSSDEVYCRLAFPGQIENKTQVLLSSQDPRFLSLCNMDTELSLV